MAEINSENVTLTARFNLFHSDINNATENTTLEQRTRNIHQKRMQLMLSSLLSILTPIHHLSAPYRR